MSFLINKEDFFWRLENVLPNEQIPDLSTEKFETEIYFEHLSMSNLEEMHQYSIDERLYEYFEFEPFKTLDETKIYLQKLLDRMSIKGEAKNAMYWFIRRTSDKCLVGTAGLVNLNYGRQSVEWGYGVDPKLWGFGYILQIQEVLKYYVFSVLKLNRLEGVTMIHNNRTISSLLATGMKQEGVLREFYCKNGHYFDGWKYAMLKSDYIEQRKIVEASYKQTTIKQIIDIISSILDTEVIDDESTMYNTATWNSLNHMAIMVALFEETKIQLSPIQISNATSVKMIEQLINGKISHQ